MCSKTESNPMYNYANTSKPEFSELLQAKFSRISDKIAKEHQKLVSETFEKVLRDRNNGELPKDLPTKILIAIDSSGVTHLLWDHPKTEVGMKVDMTKCIASVAPPKLYTPDTPQ